MKMPEVFVKTTSPPASFVVGLDGDERALALVVDAGDLAGRGQRAAGGDRSS